MKLKAKKLVFILLAIAISGVVLQLGSVLAQSGWFGGSSKPTYEEWLTSLDVHDKFKAELQRLDEKHDRGDLMVAYTFLFYQYGKIDQLEPLVKQRENGVSWEKVFTEYQNKHKAFVPQTFDTQYLESLTSAAAINSDDIMIADRLSFVSGVSVKEMLSSKLENGKIWKDIAAELNVVNGSSSLPRVEITADHLSQFTTKEFPEDKVAEAFVLAQKIGMEPKDVVSKMKTGRSEANIMAAAWSDLFSSK